VPYLIDGNNLLGSWGGPAIEGDGRLEVVRRVSAFCRARGARATIVFDGAPFRPDLGGQELGPVSLRFPPSGVDADTLVRELLSRSERPAEITVVTSDKALYSFARTRGADAWTARDWNAEARGAVPRGRQARVATSGEKPERETDIEGWLRRFSGE
jgi:predicted RNA-binding protein with PIN domain